MKPPGSHLLDQLLIAIDMFILACCYLNLRAQVNDRNQRLPYRFTLGAGRIAVLRRVAHLIAESRF